MLSDGLKWLRWIKNTLAQHTKYKSLQHCKNSTSKHNFSCCQQLVIIFSGFKRAGSFSKENDQLQIYKRNLFLQWFFAVYLIFTVWWHSSAPYKVSSRVNKHSLIIWTPVLNKGAPGTVLPWMIWGRHRSLCFFLTCTVHRVLPWISVLFSQLNPFQVN